MIAWLRAYGRSVEVSFVCIVSITPPAPWLSMPTASITASGPLPPVISRIRC
jgi:hypothetical protein